MQHGFYRWNGERWDRWRIDISSADSSTCGFQARYWRGVVPGEDYPYEQVKTFVPDYFCGTLGRAGAADTVVVKRMKITGAQMEIELTRRAGVRESEEYKCVLTREGGEFVGAANARIRGFTSAAATQFRVVATTAMNGGVAVTLILKESVAQEPRQFIGTLLKAD